MKPQGSTALTKPEYIKTIPIVILDAACNHFPKCLEYLIDKKRLIAKTAKK